MKTISKNQKQSVDYHRALLYAIPAGILAAILWAVIVIVTGWEFGLIAITIGYLVGYAAYFGAGKKGNQVLQVASAGISLVSIFIGEYLITNHYWYKQLIAEGIETQYFLKVWPVVVGTIDYVIEDPITLIFWAIALYAGYSMARPRKE